MDSEQDIGSSALRKIGQDYLRIFETLDPESISAIQSEKYEQVFAPASADPPGPLDRAAFAAHIRHLNEVLRSFPVFAKEIWPNPTLCQVTIWADSLTKFHDEVKDSADDEEWSYRGEYLFVITTDSKFEKIERVLEFVDSKGTDKFRELIARAQKKKRAAQSE